MSASCSEGGTDEIQAQTKKLVIVFLGLTE